MFLHCGYRFIKPSHQDRTSRVTRTFLSAQVPSASLVSGKKHVDVSYQSTPGYTGDREDELFRSVSKESLLQRELRI